MVPTKIPGPCMPFLISNLPPVIRSKYEANSLARIFVSVPASAEIRMGSFAKPFSAINTVSALVDWLRVVALMCAIAP